MYKLLTVATSFFPVSDVKVPLLPSHKRMDITVFKPFVDLDTQPVLFIPDVHFASLQRGSHVRSRGPSVAARKGDSARGRCGGRQGSWGVGSGAGVLAVQAV